MAFTYSWIATAWIHFIGNFFFAEIVVLILWVDIPGRRNRKSTGRRTWSASSTRPSSGVTWSLKFPAASWPRNSLRTSQSFHSTFSNICLILIASTNKPIWCPVFRHRISALGNECSSSTFYWGTQYRKGWKLGGFAKKLHHWRKILVPSAKKPISTTGDEKKIGLCERHLILGPFSKESISIDFCNDSVRMTYIIYWKLELLSKSFFNRDECELSGLIDLHVEWRKFLSL